MHFIQAILLSWLASHGALAQSLDLKAESGEVSAEEAAQEARRRAELKAMLRSEPPDALAAARALDTRQREQLRRQVREQSSR
nr:hypothetical protein [uncultured Rhodoferax sp.]